MTRPAIKNLVTALALASLALATASCKSVEDLGEEVESVRDADENAID